MSAAAWPAAAAALAAMLWPAQVAAQDNDGPPVIHISDQLNRLPETRAALAEFAESTPARKTGPAAYEVGDTRTFKVYNHAESQRRNQTVLESRHFTARAVDSLYVIWVESAELANGHVRDEDVDALGTALAVRTPDGSVDPSSGIIENAIRVFGEPPDSDGDGATDVLIVDILDGWKPGSPNGYVAGYTWGGDLTSSGNGSDIVYVDTYPGLYRNGSHIGTTVAETVFAHEFMHLIHLNYDTNEITFVDEGLAEWSPIMNGYASRAITYLQDADEHNVSLFAWRSGADVLNDYQRAGLFTSYLAQRLGPEATGEIVRRKSGYMALKGAAGYESVLSDAGLSFAEVLFDFHAANLFNERLLGEAYSHELESRRDVKASPTFSYQTVTPGRVSETDYGLNPGAVQYFVWTGGSGLELTIDISESVATNSRPGMRERVSAQLIVDGAFWDVPLGPAPTVIDRSFDEAALILVHHTPEAIGVKLDYDFAWRGGSSGVANEDESVPGAVMLAQNHPNPFTLQTSIRYELAQSGPVRLTVFDALGREMAQPVEGFREAGTHETIVDAAMWPSGVYFYVLAGEGWRTVRQMTVFR